LHIFLKDLINFYVCVVMHNMISFADCEWPKSF